MTRHRHKARAYREALTVMRKMQAQGWRCQSMLTDAGAVALEALGHDADLAADIAATVWRENFETQPPI